MQSDLINILRTVIRDKCPDGLSDTKTSASLKTDMRKWREEVGMSDVPVTGQSGRKAYSFDSIVALAGELLAFTLRFGSSRDAFRDALKAKSKRPEAAAPAPAPVIPPAPKPTLKQLTRAPLRIVANAPKAEPPPKAEQVDADPMSDRSQARRRYPNAQPYIDALTRKTNAALEDHVVTVGNVRPVDESLFSAIALPWAPCACYLSLRPRWSCRHAGQHERRNTRANPGWPPHRGQAGRELGVPGSSGRSGKPHEPPGRRDGDDAGGP